FHSGVRPDIVRKARHAVPALGGAPVVPDRLAPERDVREPAADGKVLEIPLSYGFNRGPFSLWDPTRRLLESAPLRWLHLAGLASRTGVVQRLALCPDNTSVAGLLTLSRRLLEPRVRVASPSLAFARSITADGDPC